MYFLNGYGGYYVAGEVTAYIGEIFLAKKLAGGAAEGNAVNVEYVVASEADDVLINASKNVANSRLLRKNMIRAGVEVPEYKNAAHHIVAGGSSKAAEARNILRKYGVDINSADNGVFLPTERAVTNSSYHPSLHTYRYYDKVNDLVKVATSKSDVIEILRLISKDLQSGSF